MAEAVVFCAAASTWLKNPPKTFVGIAKRARITYALYLVISEPSRSALTRPIVATVPIAASMNNILRKLE